MMLFIVLALFAAAALCTTFFTIRRRRRGPYSTFTLGETGLFIGMLAFSALFVIFTAWFIGGNLSGAGEVTRLQAFYEDTLGAYEYTIDRTENVVVLAREDLTGVITDFAYDGQGRAVSNRIAELRDKIEKYNASLRYLQKANAWPIIGGAYYDLPPELKPIKLEA